MIYTVTLNPTLDKTYSVPVLQPGNLHRMRPLSRDLSGKGVNVSRALRGLGIDSHILLLIAGPTGELFRQSLSAQGFVVHTVEALGDTRQNITLLDESSGIYTKLNEPGPQCGAEQVGKLLDTTRQLARPGDWWTLSGSLPPGAPPDLYACLIEIIQGAGGRACLDADGDALRLGLAARPFAAKPNSEESAELLGIPLIDDVDHACAARHIQHMGPRLVMITRGAQGLVLAMDEALCLAVHPPVPAYSPFGAGDSALAGLIWGLMEGGDIYQGAAHAVACATAAVQLEGTNFADKAHIEQIVEHVIVTPISDALSAG